MKKYIYNILFLSALFLTSCERETTAPENFFQISKEEKFFSDLLNANKENGSVIIQSATSTERQDNRRNIRVSEQKSRDFSKKNKSKIKFIGLDNSKLFAKNKSFEETYNMNNNFFGKELQYYVEKDGQKSAPNSVYVPDLITVNFSAQELKSGTRITWNVDDQNVNGVAVILKYDPINQNDVLLAFNNPETLIKSFITPDNNGSYTIKASDIERFPKNAYISVSVLRAAGVFPKDSSGQPAVSAITTVFTDLQVK